MVVQSPTPTIVEPLDAVEALDAGVIEEARARQRHHRGIVGGATVVAAATAAILWASVGGGGGSHPASASTAPGRPWSHVARLSLASCLASKGKALQGAPSQSLLSILGVLRRPATLADALPPAIEADLYRGAFGGDIFVRYIRRARMISGTSYYIYPALTGACGAHKAHEDIMHLATHVRLAPGIYGGSGGGGETAAMIEQGRGFGTGPPGISGLPHASGTIVMVVPDGVANVTLRYPPGAANGFRPKVISPAVTIRTAPVNNLLVVDVPRSSGGGAILRATMTWSAADGHIIKAFSRL